MKVILGVDYASRGGLTIRIYAIDGSEPYPIHGAMLLKSGWLSMSWARNGSFLQRNEHPNDIVGVYVESLAIQQQADIAELNEAVTNLTRILSKLEGPKA